MKKIYKGCVIIEAPLKFGIIKIGIGNAVIPNGGGYGYFNVDENASVVFKGKAIFNGATSIIANANSSIIFGNNFSCNDGCEFFSDKKITFGENILMGWKCAFHDGDGHDLIFNGEVINNPREINVGDNVWIGADCIFLKGAGVADGSVVARNSLVTKKFQDSKTLIGGHPAKIIRTNVIWNR